MTTKISSGKLFNHVISAAVKQLAVGELGWTTKTTRITQKQRTGKKQPKQNLKRGKTKKNTTNKNKKQEQTQQVEESSILEFDTKIENSLELNQTNEKSKKKSGKKKKS